MVLLLALCSLAKAVFVIIDFESSMVKSIFSCLPCSLNVVVVVNIIIVIGFVSYHVRSYPLFLCILLVRSYKLALCIVWQFATRESTNITISD